MHTAADFCAAIALLLDNDVHLDYSLTFGFLQLYIFFKVPLSKKIKNAVQSQFKAKEPVGIQSWLSSPTFMVVAPLLELVPFQFGSEVSNPFHGFLLNHFNANTFLQTTVRRSCCRAHYQHGKWDPVSCVCIYNYFFSLFQSTILIHQAFYVLVQFILTPPFLQSAK